MSNCSIVVIFGNKRWWPWTTIPVAEWVPIDKKGLRGKSERGARGAGLPS